MPVPATNLIADFNGALGKTTSGGRVTQWVDQVNGHVASEATTDNQPDDGADYIEFGGSSGGSSAEYRSSRLRIADTLTMALPNVSVYVVASGNRGVDTFAIVHLLGEGPFAWIRGIYAGDNASGNGPTYLACDWKSSTNRCRVPLTKAVLAGIGGAATSYCRVNNYHQPLEAAVGGTDTLTGAWIGCKNGDADFFSGRIYRLLIYTVAHSQAQADAVAASLAADHGVSLDPTNLIVFEGDSLVQGATALGLLNYPNQVTIPAGWIAFNMGQGGHKIGAAATAGTIANLAPDQLDKLLTANGGTFTRKVLCVLAGTNDISSDSLTGAQCFTTLTTFLADRLTAGFNETWANTLPDRGSVDTQITDHNNLLRGGDASITLTLDKGKGASDTRLSDSSNLTYYISETENLHLTAGGYAVLAEATTAAISPADTTAPTVTLATVGSDGVTVAILVANGPLNPDSIPDESKFSINGVPRGGGDVVVFDATTVIVILAVAATHGQSLTLVIQAGNGVVDEADNELVAGSFAVDTSGVPPVARVTRVTWADATHADWLFSVPADTPGAVGLKINGVSGTDAAFGGGNAIRVTYAAPIAVGDPWALVASAFDGSFVGYTLDDQTGVVRGAGRPRVGPLRGYGGPGVHVGGAAFR